jgi:hypothetical protein
LLLFPFLNIQLAEITCLLWLPFADCSWMINPDAINLAFQQDKGFGQNLVSTQAPQFPSINPQFPSMKDSCFEVL